MKFLFIIVFILFCSKSFTQTLSSVQQKELINAKNGQSVNLGNFIQGDFKSIDYQKIILPGPQYIISDDPEYIRIPEAIALKEQVQPGAVRLYVYNVNGVKEPKIPRKITAIIKNIGTQTMRLTMLKYSSQLPSGDYFKIGKQGLADYFNSTPLDKVIKIKPGKVIPIDQMMDERIFNYDDLAHGIYEFVIDQPAEIAVLQTSPETKSSEAYQAIGEAVPSNHKNAGRGLFGISNYLVRNKEVIDTDKPSQLIVADGKLDPWIVGKEYTSGKASTLAGNYGVMYDIELEWKSSNGKALALVTWNARADNKWCSAMANCVVVGDDNQKLEIINLPSDKLTTKGSPEAVLIKVFKPIAGQEIQKIKLKYSPPGASCLPTPLILIPVDL